MKNDVLIGWIFRYEMKAEYEDILVKGRGDFTPWF